MVILVIFLGAAVLGIVWQHELLKQARDDEWHARRRADALQEQLERPRLGVTVRDLEP